MEWIEEDWGEEDWGEEQVKWVEEFEVNEEEEYEGDEEDDNDDDADVVDDDDEEEEGKEEKEGKEGKEEGKEGEEEQEEEEEAMKVVSCWMKSKINILARLNVIKLNCVYCVFLFIVLSFLWTESYKIPRHRMLEEQEPPAIVSTAFSSSP